MKRGKEKETHPRVEYRHAWLSEDQLAVIYTAYTRLTGRRVYPAVRKLLVLAARKHGNDTIPLARLIYDEHGVDDLLRRLIDHPPRVDGEVSASTSVSGLTVEAPSEVHQRDIAAPWTHAELGELLPTIPPTGTHTSGGSFVTENRSGDVDGGDDRGSADAATPERELSIEDDYPRSAWDVELPAEWSARPVSRATSRRTRRATGRLPRRGQPLRAADRRPPRDGPERCP
ncbi:MAG: hypothetical protein ACLQBX_06995 [Candidatus Limnocylindrales bacterium]